MSENKLKRKIEPLFPCDYGCEGCYPEGELRRLNGKIYCYDCYDLINEDKESESFVDLEPFVSERSTRIAELEAELEAKKKLIEQMREALGELLTICSDDLDDRTIDKAYSALEAAKKSE